MAVAVTHSEGKHCFLFKIFSQELSGSGLMIYFALFHPSFFSLFGVSCESQASGQSVRHGES